MNIKVFSKSAIKRYRPTTETVLISVQDSGYEEKSRNFISHSRYRSILWLYFDDIESENPPYSFSPSQARQIIETVVAVEANSPKTTIAVHCEVGVSRSQAIAHFIASHFGTPSQIAEIENRDVPQKAGNKLVRTLLEQTYEQYKKEVSHGHLYK
jgi:predicted protein tyrosine phosphatase